MSGIYWSDGTVRIANYSSASRAGKSPAVRIELEVLDPYELGHILQSLERARAEQTVAKASGQHGDKRAARPAVRPAKPPPAVDVSGG